MKRKMMSLLLAMLLVLSMALPASAAFNSEAKESVVFVSFGVECDYYSEEYSSGSGFFVGKEGTDPTYLITNYHVIQSYVEDFLAGEPFEDWYEGHKILFRAKLWVSFDDNDRVEVYPVVYNAQKDVAILKLAEATDKRVPAVLRSPDTSMSGSEVYAIGYPGISDNAAAEPIKDRGLNDQTVTGGKFSRLLTTQGTGQSNIQIDCKIYHGNSGGPLVNEAGEVLGICTWGITTSEDTLNYAVSIDEAIALMNQNNIPYTMAGDEEPEPSEAPTEAPAATETPTEATVPAPTEPVAKPMGTGTIIGIACAVVAALAIVVLLVMNSKKKQPKAAPAPAAPAPAPAARKAYVRSLAANHGGMRVALQTGKAVLIGRSKADCAISFADNAPGVSGRHCSVLWDGNAFVLTDMNSSYGTYLQNGQKLVAGKAYTLQPGTSFWLGDKQNILRVELE